MEDSLRLREELAQLKKDILTSKKIKEDLDIHIKGLHSEELRYLGEIPQYKKQSEDAKNRKVELENKIIPIRKEFDLVLQELTKVKDLVVKEEKALIQTREYGHNVEKECAIKKVDLAKREEFLKVREEAVHGHEKDCVSREMFYKKVEFDLDNKEINIKSKECALDKAHQELLSAKNSHSKNLENHTERVNSLSEQRKFLEEDKQLVKDKLGKVDKLVKDHCELKAQLLLQADKASKSIKSAEDKQIMLDKALNELQHQENTLRIKELKIRKMAHEAGLQKELKELEESLK